VRKILGVQGAKMRREIVDKSLYRKPRPSGWSDVIPEALTQIEDWKAVEIAGPAKALILSDLHIPHHDVKAIELALQYGIDNRADLILLNGDIIDCYSLSMYEKDPKLRDFPAEVRATKFFLAGLRKRFPNAQMVWRWGNHCERFEKYMRMKAPDLLGLPEFEWESIFGLKEYDISLIKDKRVVRLGKLNTLHGHELPTGISSPVNPSRGLFLRTKCSAICGHWHQASSHSEKNLEQKVITTWSTGCLCNLHPQYRPLNLWAHGFAFVEIDKNGGFQVENKRIIDGRVW
jgi:predicted phosphodiesterase